MEWTVAVGVDTHKAVHVAVALDRLGCLLGSCAVEAAVPGYEQLYGWASSLGVSVFAIEGAASYGAGLARFLRERGLPVFESERPSRRDRRGGKNDCVDAELAARRLLAGNGLSELRGGGVRELLRVLLLERRSADQARTACLNQLHALAVTAPPPLRARLAGRNRARLAVTAARLRARASDDLEQRALIEVIRRLGARANALADELAASERSIDELVRAVAPDLLDECGVGPICAAQLIVSSGERGRMRSEAAFAALAGTSPVEASSGPTRRHRLNRGGDRQLNAALHRIALTRTRFHPETAAYHQRLLARGKSKREALRCIKRMLARHLYPRLRAIPSLELTQRANT
jgi:transposase